MKREKKHTSIQVHLIERTQTTTHMLAAFQMRSALRLEKSLTFKRTCAVQSQTIKW